MSESAIVPTVWGLFTGERGDQLPALTRLVGPFPPIAGSEGWVAIGWPALGSMKIWENDYATYYKKFRIVYDEGVERIIAMRANELWNFAFEMKLNDWVISPCSSEGVLLVGKIQGEYEFDPGDAKSAVRRDFVHFRKVRWLYVIKSSDARYKKLNRIGRLTLSRSNLIYDELQITLQDIER